MNFTIGILIAALIWVLTLLTTNSSPAGKLRDAAEDRNLTLNAAQHLIP